MLVTMTLSFSAQLDALSPLLPEQGLLTKQQNLLPTKAYADEKFIVAKSMISVFDGVENIMGHYGNQHFLLFPHYVF